VGPNFALNTQPNVFLMKLTCELRNRSLNDDNADENRNESILNNNYDICLPCASLPSCGYNSSNPSPPPLCPLVGNIRTSLAHEIFKMAQKQPLVVRGWLEHRWRNARGGGAAGSMATIRAKCCANAGLSWCICSAIYPWIIYQLAGHKLGSGPNSL